MPTSRYLVVLAALALLAACGGGRGGIDPADVPDGVRAGPEGDEFYQAQQPPGDARPGDLVWARRLPAPDDMRAYGMLYWSTDVHGDLVPVSGMVFGSAARAGRVPLFGWAPGSQGLARQCAPSIEKYRSRRIDITLERAVLRMGMTFVSTDYQGLGTPGEHPYLVNVVAGRNLLDAVRAGAQLVGSPEGTEVVLAGESQGGAATLLAAELQPTYAPELHLRAALALAPPSQLADLDELLDGGPYFGYVLMAVHGYQAAYPELEPLAQHLTPEGRAALEVARERCAGAILFEYKEEHAARFGVDAIVNAPSFVARLEENEPGTRGTDVPILIVHGDADDTVPLAHSAQLVERYCEHGAVAATEVIAGAGHRVLQPAAETVRLYVRARLSGLSAPSDCN